MNARKTVNRGSFTRYTRAYGRGLSVARNTSMTDGKLLKEDNACPGSFRRGGENAFSPRIFIAQNINKKIPYSNTPYLYYSLETRGTRLKKFRFLAVRTYLQEPNLTGDHWTFGRNHCIYICFPTSREWSERVCCTQRKPSSSARDDTTENRYISITVWRP